MGRQLGSCTTEAMGGGTDYSQTDARTNKPTDFRIGLLPLFGKNSGEVLEERGFICESPYEEYVLSGEGKNVWVYLNDEALEVVRNQVIYNGAMHYELGSDELCDLWEMIRKAWDADE